MVVIRRLMETDVRSDVGYDGMNSGICHVMIVMYADVEMTLRIVTGLYSCP